MTPFTYAIRKYLPKDKRGILFQLDAANSNDQVATIMKNHLLSTEELYEWRVRYDDYGLSGLKVRIKQRRKA